MKYNTLEITEQPEGFGFISMRELVNQALRKNIDIDLLPGAIPSGFTELDKYLGGFEKGKLYTVAVRPGMGKTAFLLSMANNMAIKDNYSVAVFSSERSNSKMARRIIESETGLSLDKIQSGIFKDSRRDHMLSQLSNIAKAKIYIDDTANLSLETILKKAAQLKNSPKADIIIVDYLELIFATADISSERAHQPGVVLSGLKQVASDVGVPVLVFSQAAAQINGYGGYDVAKCPSASALPGYLREHSDVLMLLHRHDAYASAALAGRSAGELFIIRKDTVAQGGVLDEHSVPLHFIGSIEKFTNF